MHIHFLLEQILWACLVYTGTSFVHCSQRIEEGVRLLEMEIAVSFHVVTCNQTRVLCKRSCALYDRHLSSSHTQVLKNFHLHLQQTRTRAPKLQPPLCSEPTPASSVRDKRVAEMKSMYLSKWFPQHSSEGAGRKQAHPTSCREHKARQGQVRQE